MARRMLLSADKMVAGMNSFLNQQVLVLNRLWQAVNICTARRTLTLGSCHYTRRDLEEIRDAGQMIHIRVLGLASIAADVSPELALATIASVEVLGAFRAPTAVKAVLAARTA